jgi:hypothetical protein
LASSIFVETKSEASIVLKRAFDLEPTTAAAAFRRLRTSGTIQIFGVDRFKIHDAMRPLGRTYLSDSGCEHLQNAREAIRDLLMKALPNEHDRQRVFLLLKMFVALGNVKPLVEMANREVRANRVRKSVGAENTFSTDLTEFGVMVSELQPLIDKIWRHCEEKGSRGRTVTLKVKFNDFEMITRSRSVPVAVSSSGELECLSVALLQNEMPVRKPVRLLGVSLSALQHADDAEPQLALPM